MHLIEGTHLRIPINNPNFLHVCAARALQGIAGFHCVVLLSSLSLCTASSHMCLSPGKM